MPAVHLGPNVVDSDDELKRFALRQAPPWLVSTIVHAFLIILLWLIAVAPRNRNEDPLLNANIADRLGDQLFDDRVNVADAVDTPEEIAETFDNLESVEDPFVAPETIALLPTGDFTPEPPVIDAKVIGESFQWREEGSKNKLLAAYGADAVITEEAVKRGLAWLAKQQNKKTGAWSMKGPFPPGCQFASTYENASSATAMALLAFTAAGSSHKAGQYQKTVAAGLNALLQMQDADGNFFSTGSHGEAFYTQAQCTIALCELYGLSRDSALRPQAELALKYCLDAQDPELGGWKYQYRVGSDTSVTGWMVMALQSAKIAGLTVPSLTSNRIMEFLDKVQSADGSKYRYMADDEETTRSMTAEGLLCREYLGWAQDDTRLINGCDYLLTELPNVKEHDVYYWYYATQTMYHMEGQYWKRWNAVIHKLLVDTQEKSGSEAGSWNPLAHDDHWATRAGGRLYQTCLSLYMLEVYYRHLPIYRKQAK